VLASSDVAFAELMAGAARFRNVSVEALTERWHKAGVPMGTPEQAVSSFAALEQVGVAKYYLQWLDLTDHRGIDELLASVQSIGF
jgi:hypothetical protein